MSFDVMLKGGPADDAYFSGHQLPWPPPQRIRVAVGGPAVALLDLPHDQLELGEREVEYVRHPHFGPAYVCTRGRGGACNLVLTYVPAEAS